MKTRLLNIGILHLLLCIGSPGCSDDHNQRRPNFIFILIDDLGKEWISCYGSASVETPNIDRISKEGILFHNAYSMPQCTPSRVALLTGQYPFTNGWINHYDVPRWGHGANFDASLNPCFPKILKSGGYRTCAAGKWQINDFRLEPDAMVQAGFDEYCMWTGGEGGNETDSDKRYWDPYIHTMEGSKTYEGAFGPDIFCDFINGFMKKNQDHPMCIYYPMVLTHTPFVHTPHHPDAGSNFEKHRAMVLYTDFIIGRIIKSLDQLKIKDHTWLFITTDNGTTSSMIGERNGVFVRGGKTFLTENGVNAPFIVLGPGRKQGFESEVPIDFTDIYPTLLELADIDISPNDRIEGSSFAAILTGEEKPYVREWILSMGAHPAMIGSGDRVQNYFAFRDRVMRDKTYKVYIDTLKRIYRVYDLKADPYEMNNLFKNQHLIKPVIEKFSAILESFPSIDGHPRYEKLNRSYYDIPAGDLNRISAKVHSRYGNMLPLAPQEEYLQLMNQP